MLGGIITLLLRNKEFDKADEAMEVLDKNQDKIVGVPKLDALSLYVDECINQKLPSKAIVSVLIFYFRFNTKKKICVSRIANRINFCNFFKEI